MKNTEISLIMVILLYVWGSWVQRENEVKICIGMRLNALSNIFKLFKYPSPSEGRQIKNHSHRNLTNLITWTTALFNSMKLWVVPCRATQDGRVIVESSDKTWSTGEGNGKPFQYSCLENPRNSMKRQTDMTLKDELPRSAGAQCATGDQRRNNSRKNEEMEWKQKQQPVVDVTGDGSKSDAVKSNIT